MNVKDRPRLGKGLKALISTNTPIILNATPPKPAPTDNIKSSKLNDGLYHVPLDLIDANPHQPREKIDPATLEELVTSVKASGILQPILLRPVGGTEGGGEEGGRYQLVAGHRRTEAARRAGLATIPAIIRSDSTDALQAEWALIENIQREDLNAIERARAYRQYLDRFALTHAQAATRLGEDRTTITNYVRLLDLSPIVQEFISQGSLSAGHAKVLAGIADPLRQNALAQRAVAENLSVRKIEELAASPPADQTLATQTSVSAHSRTLIAKSPHVLELEQELSRKLGTKLRIFPSKRKNTGKIVIQYFSLDEFDRIVEKFN